MAQVDDWASDANFSAGSDPWSAQPTKVEPSGTIKGRGFLPGTTPPAGWFNWIFNQIITNLNLKTDSPGTVTDNEIPRWHLTNGQTFQTSGMRVSDAIELEYISAKTRTVILSAVGGSPGKDPGATEVAKWYVPNITTDAGTLSCATDSAPIVFDLSWLPDGATLTKVRALIDPGAARVGTGRMNLRVQKRTVSLSSPSAGTNSDVCSVFDDATANRQVIDSGAISELVDKAGGKLMVATIVSGNTSSGSIDSLEAIEVTFTDPGPKNV
jgi:hypothetical protein